jgi:hypothetical protein
VERGFLIGAAYLRWASWIWLTAIALANLHRDHDVVLAIAAIAVTGVVTVAATMALRAGYETALRPPMVLAEVVTAAGVLLADGWVRQGRLTGQTLSGSWPIPSILVAALADGLVWGLGTAVVLGGSRAAAVAISGWAPGPPAYALRSRLGPALTG